jgi:hypothetical protein
MEEGAMLDVPTEDLISFLKTFAAPEDIGTNREVVTVVTKKRPNQTEVGSNRTGGKKPRGSNPNVRVLMSMSTTS